MEELVNIEAHKKLNEEKNRLMNGKSQYIKDILTILPGLRMPIYLVEHCF